LPAVFRSQSPMVILKMLLLGQTHDSQSTRDRSLAGGQDGPHQENLRTVPDTLGKQRTKCKDNERHLPWQVRNKTLHNGLVATTHHTLCMHKFGPRPHEPEVATRTVSVGTESRTASRAAMDKVELSLPIRRAGDH